MPKFTIFIEKYVFFFFFLYEKLGRARLAKCFKTAKIFDCKAQKFKLLLL